MVGRLTALPIAGLTVGLGSELCGWRADGRRIGVYGNRIDYGVPML